MSNLDAVIDKTRDLLRDMMAECDSELAELRDMQKKIDILVAQLEVRLGAKIQ